MTLSWYDLLLPPGIKELKGVFREQSYKIRSTLPVAFFEKVVLKILGKFIENHLQQHLLKAHNSVGHELYWSFSRNFYENIQISHFKGKPD